MVPRTIVVPADIVAVPRRSPSRVRRRTPCPEHRDGQSVERAGGREWLSDSLADRPRATVRTAFGTSVTAHLSCVVALVAGFLAPGDPFPAVRMTSRLVMPVLLSPAMPEVAEPSPKPARVGDIRLSHPAEPQGAEPDATEENLVTAPVEAPAAIGPESPFETGTGSADSTGTGGSAAGGEGHGGGSDRGGPGTGGVSGARRLQPSISPPRKIRDVRPEYPAGALRDQTRGTVVLDVTIGVDGRVVEAAVVRSIPELDRAALDAVRQWEFIPASLNGTPIAVIVTVVVNFSIL